MRGSFYAPSPRAGSKGHAALSAFAAILVASLGGTGFAQTSTAAAELVDLTGGLPPLLELPTASLDEDDRHFQVFGFADFSFFKGFIDSSNYVSAFVPEYSSFYVGNINTYFRTTFDRFTSLVELRFLYAPHGSFDAQAAGGNIDNEIPDAADPSSYLKWGGIEIERAWLEFEVDGLLQLRVGQWLTPYGIWNIDHGSPTVIGVRRPYIIGQEYMPERQTGLQAKGAIGLGVHKFGYHFTLSNGRGKVDAIADLDSNKGLGTRIYYELMSSLELSLGLSGYIGRYTSANTQITTDGGELRFIRVIDRQYDEIAFAADLKIEWQGLLLQSEFIVNRRRYTEEGRNALVLEPGRFAPDHVFWGTYGLLAYRIPGSNLMPYLMVERAIQPIGIIRFSGSNVVYLGVNWRVHPRVTVKGEAVYLTFIGDNKLAESDSWGLQSQVAWAF